MPGLFNVYNALAAIAAAGLEGIGLEAVRSSLSTIAVPGRVQPIPTGRPFQVIVDYAHNAVSLENLLSTLREYTTGRLIVLFGNGGDRARSRRFEMGEVAGRLADLAVITSDNPRTEDPLAIIDDILIGLTPTGGQHVVIPDRRAAIFWSVGAAQPGDMIIIAEKDMRTTRYLKTEPFILMMPRQLPRQSQHWSQKMAKYSLSEIIQWTYGVLTDETTMNADPILPRLYGHTELVPFFIALRGPNFDGMIFLARPSLKEPLVAGKGKRP